MPTTQRAGIPGKRWTRVLACLLGLYVINFIDRNNIGFAVIGGMDQELHINTAQSGCRAPRIARLRAIASGKTPGITRQAPPPTRETTLDRDTGYFSQRPIHSATYDHC